MDKQPDIAIVYLINIIAYLYLKSMTFDILLFASSS
jgi:hypothetical protein